MLCFHSLNCSCLFVWQGIDKRDLLEEVLAIIVKNISLQRLYTQYKDELLWVKQHKSESPADVFNESGNVPQLSESVNSDINVEPSAIGDTAANNSEID